MAYAGDLKSLTLWVCGFESHSGYLQPREEETMLNKNTENVSINESNPVIMHLENKGRIFRRRSGRRIITVAWKRVGDSIFYGATIFRDEKDNKLPFRRKDHNLTAVNRLNQHHVEIPAISVENFHMSKIEDYIRKAVAIHGCRSSAELDN